MEYRTSVAVDLINANDARGIQTRTWLAVREFLDAHPGESLVAVTHGWGVPTIVAALLGQSLEDTRGHFPANAFGWNAGLSSVTRVFRHDESSPWELDTALINNISHLTDDGVDDTKPADPATSAPFEKAAADYFSGRDTPWPLRDASKL